MGLFGDANREERNKSKFHLIPAMGENTCVASGRQLKWHQPEKEAADRESLFDQHAQGRTPLLPHMMSYP